MYADAISDGLYAEFYEEHADQARQEFRADRLRSYYAAHPSMAQVALTLLAGARALREASLAASLVRATTASELGIKNLLLRPIVFGLVHNESIAGVVTSPALSHSGLDSYHDLLLAILNDHAGVDLATYSRPNTPLRLWLELKENQKVRNGVIHRGEEPTAVQRDLAIAVAETILDLLFPQVVGRLGFDLHGPLLCDESHVSEDVLRMLARLD